MEFSPDSGASVLSASVPFQTASRLVSRVLLVLVYCSLSWVGFGSGSTHTTDQIAAVVETEVITLSELLWLVRYRNMEFPEDEKGRKEFLLRLLDQLIDQKLAAREVKETLVIRASDHEVQAQLQAYRDRFPSEVEFQERLKQMEMTLDDLTDLVRRQLAVLKFIKMRFEPFVVVLPDQIALYYEEEFVPRLKQEGLPVPSLPLVEKQIREILTLRRANLGMERWLRTTRAKARVEILLFREPPRTPNLPPGLRGSLSLQPVPIEEDH